MTVISVIVGSTREGRFSEKPAKWIFQHLKKRAGVEARLLDLTRRLESAVNAAESSLEGAFRTE